MANFFDVLTVTLNPAIDRALRIAQFTLGRVNRAEAPVERAGGKGVNVARNLARAGWRVAAAGVLGKENAGIFEEMFAKEGISDLCLRRPGRTRDGLKITDPGKGGITEINLPGLTIGPDCLEELMIRLEGIEAGWVVLSGSLPPGLGPETYAAMVSRLKKPGRKVAVDTSGAALRYAIEAEPDLIKPNLEELEGVMEKSLEKEEVLLEMIGGLITRGIQLVAVSMGAQGAVIADAKEATWAVPPSVVVMSTVGAGDAMLAGLIHGDLRGDSLQDQARLGTAWAAATVAGGEGGYGTALGLLELAGKVQLRPVGTPQ